MNRRKDNSMLSDEIKSMLLTNYYLTSTEELEGIEDYLRCEIEDGGNTDFVKDILREIRELVQEELANRIQDRLEEITKARKEGV